MRADAQETLVLYNWADYFPPALATKFESETGIRIFTEVYRSNEELLAGLRMQAGNYDVVVPSDYMVKILIDEGLLQAVDAPAMANFVNVKPPFDDPWYDPGRRFSVPNMHGTSGFVYDPRQVLGGKLDESWSEFFEPRPETVGKVVALDDQRELYQAAAHYLGIDPCTEDPADAQRILDVLIAQKPKLAFYTSGTNPNVEDPLQEGIAMIADGTVAIAQSWDGGARLVRRAVPEVAYVIPREGASLWEDAYAIPYGAWNPENAKVFLNWIMRPDNIAAVSSFSGYTNGIAGSERLMDEDLAEDQSAALAPEILDRLKPAQACSEIARDLNDKAWARLWPRTVK
jgi:spermidine/putrescine transport system substrate-binding protein